MDERKDNGQVKDTATVLDLSDFVTEVDRFSRLIEPFALVFYTIDDIRRWQFRNRTIVVWLVCNLACLWLTQGAAFVLASSLVIGIATLSLLQVHTQILNKLLPGNTKQVKSNQEEEQGGNLDVVHNFRYSCEISVMTGVISRYKLGEILKLASGHLWACLMCSDDNLSTKDHMVFFVSANSQQRLMHDFVVKSNEYLNYFYSILRWDSVGPSAIYHIEACMFLLSLVVCPARWNCFLFINWFFLCHPHILRRGYRFLRDYWPFLKQPSYQKEQKSEDKNEKDEDNCENDDDDSSDQDLTDKVADSSLVSLDPSPAKPGMVARLNEIKKRRKQIASEVCEGCKVSLVSILKKRLYCRHCGYSFCNKCCYQTVPRSVFGATSPAALKETVLVCCSCHALLVNQGDATSEICKGQGPG